MKKPNLTIKQKQIILVVASVLVLAIAFFAFWQPNAQEVEEIEQANAKLENQVNYLESLQTKVTELEQESQKKETEMNGYLECFAPRITLEKCIYYIYMMSIDTEIKVTSIEPGNEEVFFENGQTMAGVNKANAANANEKLLTEDQMKEKKPINQMVGKQAKYKIGLQGPYENVMEALDWVRDHKENMSLGETTLAYDSGTGELSGSIAVSFYSMQGNGVQYKAPNLSGFKFGEDNVFGTFLSDNAEDDSEAE